MGCLGTASIDVYDLGTLGDQLSKVVTINHRAIAGAIGASCGINQDHVDQETLNSSFKQFKMASIHPITVRESNTLHLLIVTQNKLRLYVGFAESQKREAVLIRDQEKRGLQYDRLLSRRISSKFTIFKSQSFPNDDLVTETYSQCP